MAEVTKQPNHFILVHGACHGAWCWYRVKPLLKAAGHRVTVVDLAAAGINAKKLEDLRTFREYTQPLLENIASLPSNEKVILVGHSLGGLSLAMAMEEYPSKVSVGVFLTAFMPDTSHPPSYVVNQYLGDRSIDGGGWLDTKFENFGTPEQPLTSMFFGPNFLTSMIYQRCSIESLELAKALVRRSSLFIEDLVKANRFSDERYGSVSRVYIVCDDDHAIPEEFQRWMIGNFGVNHVMEINGSDHMPMFCKPQELSDCLLNVANNYAS